MATIDALRELGADTADGLQRCMNNESFYLRMVDMGLKDANFEKLQKAVSEGDLKNAFEAAHALKGIMANLALTPIQKPVSEITELLRAGTQTDYGPLVGEILSARDRFTALDS